jgi:ATP-dependent exoDNAse (exonuclease V) beta subunit
VSAAETTTPADAGVSDLTPEQAAAVAARDRDVFCEAGAGTGKTRVLVRRYCEAVADDGVEIERILAITFTERAGAELRGRVRAELMSRSREAGDAARRRELATLARATERSWVMTIHAFCRRLLAAHPLAAGLDPRFRVLDEAEAGRLRARAIADALAAVTDGADQAVARALAAYRPWRIGDMAVALHERLRNQGMSSPRLPELPDPVRSTKPGDEETPALSPTELEAAHGARAALEALVEEFGSRYSRLKQERSALDFADLELEALDLLRNSEPVRAQWRGRFAHVMVDEFQDTNRVQLDLVDSLRGPETRVFVVGDEQQSIYRFRNADLEVFRAERARAAADPGTDLLPLRGNFRSTASILQTVNAVGTALIESYAPLAGGSAEPPVPAELLLTNDGQGRDAVKWADLAEELDPPAAERTAAYVAEARNLAAHLRRLVDSEEIERGETVVLLRAFTHVDAYHEALERFGLDPYVVGGRGYWSQQQVEDLIRLLGVISNPLDDEMLFGALACPAVGVGPDTLWLLRRAIGQGGHVWPLVEWRYGGSGREPAELETEWLDAISAEDAMALERFCSRLANLRAAAPVTPIESLVERAMDAFDYDLELLARRDGAGRMANVRKLMRLAREFEGHDGRDLAGFLAAAEASTVRNEREGMAPVTAEGHDGVRIMTVHAAKGLEFGVVAVPDLQRGLSKGHRNGDLAIAGDAAGPARFGMRLAFPSSESVGLWELHDLHAEESTKESEEGARLVYVAATRAKRRLILSGTFKDSDLEVPDEEKHGDSPLRRLLPALTATGWSGGNQELANPPLSIQVTAPGEEQARELSARPDPVPRAGRAEPEGEPVHLPPPESRLVPVGHLSYSSLADYERCGYRFYAERVLGLAPGALGFSDAAADEELTADLDELSDLPEEDRRSAEHRSRSLAFGNAVHAALEWSARNRWSEPRPEWLEALVAGAGAGALERAQRLIAGWLGSPLLDELRGAAARPEVPFALPLGGTVVRGKIDLLAQTSAGPVVVDFKTDAIGGDGVAGPGEHYRVQRELYALVAAAASGGDERPVRAIHLFLEAPGEPVETPMGPLEIAAARDRLAELVGRMRAGDYTPTEAPTRQVCSGCPAAWNLCPHPAWHPQREGL